MVAGLLQGRALVSPLLKAHSCLQHLRRGNSKVIRRYYSAWYLQKKLSHTMSACAASVDVQQSISPSHVLSKMSWEGRDKECGTLREEDTGSSFTLCGWVHRQRNLGGKAWSSTSF